MVFSTNLFLFVFLPVFLACLLVLPGRFRNAFILLASLVFYAAGSGVFVWILLFSIVWNYYAAHVMAKNRSRLVLSIAVAVNLALLAYFKYANFFWYEFSSFLAGLGVSIESPLLSIVLPIGISFYTFQAVSYLVDVYRDTVKPANSLIGFGMYLANFPQLIAGPIVRYSEIQKNLFHRPITLNGFSEGIYRFCIGLGKKILLADATGEIADAIFALPANELTTPLAWLGVTAYTLQIYFDFSGYSDMAIGLGKMMGFTFPENFNQPYRSSSITEFWRRWHMTLSNWFRDYLYIPLGGNRCGRARTYFNLFTVFLLCGLWHGAAYTFIAWGMFHGVLLTVERILFNRYGVRPYGIAGGLVTLVLVMLGWVLFRSDSIGAAWVYMLSMFGAGEGVQGFFGPAYYLTHDRIFILCVAILIALVPFEKLKAIADDSRGSFYLLAKRVFSLAVLSLVAIELAGKMFNPFIYFRF
jgi:alginate O-acetyltransferase complex protein AlgI